MRLLLAAIACLACFNAAHANEFYEAGQRHHTDKARAQTAGQRCVPLTRAAALRR